MASVPEFGNAEMGISKDNNMEGQQFSCRVDEIFQKVDEVRELIYLKLIIFLLNFPLKGRLVKKIV